MQSASVKKGEQRRTVPCYCGSLAVLQSNSKIYHGKEFGNGRAYICERWPECDGYIGTHPDGKPLGPTVPDRETRELRKKLHRIIDPLWQNQPHKKKARGSVYGWLRRITKLDPLQVHVGHWDAEQCRKVLKLIEENPYEVRR